MLDAVDPPIYLLELLVVLRRVSIITKNVCSLIVAGENVVSKALGRSKWLRRTWTRNWMRSLGLLGGCWSWAGELVNCGRDDCCCGLGARFGAAIPETAGTTRERERDAQISCSSGTRRTRSDRVAQNSSLSPHRLADKAYQAPTQHSVTCYDASRAPGGGGAAQFTRRASFHDHDLHDIPHHANRTSRGASRALNYNMALIVVETVHGYNVPR